MANKQIKGLTIEIGGDTTKLGKALKDSEDKSKSLQAELRQIETALKFNPDNVELLTQKQKVLADEVQSTSEKLKTLRTASEQAAKSAKNYDAWKAKYDPLQAEIEKTAQKLKELKASQAEMAEVEDIGSEAYQALQTEIEETAKGLKTLRKQVQDVNEEFGNPASPEQLRELQREVIQTESKLKNYESKLGETEKKLKGLADGTDIAERETKEFKDELKKAEDTLGDVKDAASDLAEGLGKIGAAGVAGATAAIMSANNTETALNSLQAQTGLTEEQMGDFKESLEDLYKGNYGESMDALADAMAKVAQFTGETDPTKIEDMTRNLITLEDTFGMDFNETLRGVDALMKNMGLSADEAFNLIAKGAQNGLNKSDELGDNLAEYTQLWAQAGFSAEEMFAILDNGLDSGAYNLDKVNDFVKEFSISLSDGRIEENIESFSSKTQGLFKAWKKGKASSADVFKSVIKDLKNTTNEQEALTTASNVWSSLGEDNALKIIQSLGDVNKTFEDVGGTMEEINAIKYDDVGSRFAALGRTVMVDVVNPIGEKLLPIAEKFVKYATENLDDLIPIVTTLGAAFATIFVVNKVANFIDSIKSLSGVISSLFTMISAHPVGALVTALGVAAGAMWALSEASDAQIEKAWGLTDAEKDLNEAIAARADAIATADDARATEIEGIDTEIGHCQNLWSELQKIVTENGKIKQGYEERAAVITGLLAEALGIEIEIVNGQIVKYGELKRSIEEVINTKRAEALLDVGKEAYTAAVAGQTDAFAEYQKKIEQVAESEQRLADAQEHYGNILANGSLPKSEAQFIAYNNELMNAKRALEEATEAHNKNNDALDQAAENYLGYCNTIEQYEGLMGAVASGDAAKLTEAMDKVSNSFVTAENATKSMLENQLKEFTAQYEAMKLAVENGMPGVSQEQVDQMAHLVDLANLELKKLEPEAYERGAAAIEEFGLGIQSMESMALYRGQGIAMLTDQGLSSADTESTGGAKGSEFCKGLLNQDAYALLAGKQIGRASDKGLGSPSTKKTGEEAGKKYADGVEGKKDDAKKAGKTVAEKGKDGMASVDTKGTGKNFADGFGEGISSAESSIWGKAAGLAKTALAAMSQVLQTHSPSKETMHLGEFFGQGFGDGIEAEHDAVVKQAETLAKDALAALDKANAVDFGGSRFLQADRALQVKANLAERNTTNAATATLAAKLDALSDKLGRMQIVLDTGTLVGETIDKIDAGLAEKQILTARGG